MEKMKFKCTLLSDIILSQSASTEGNQFCLDFIPGNNFLGIVAALIYYNVEALDVFHSGKVRFGDANPSIEGVRGLKVPNAMFYPKLQKASEVCYIHHLIPHPDSDDIKGLQLKQCRQGFYVFYNSLGKPVSIEKNYTIKSAYDSKKRKSEDGKMFGYQSLPEGLILYFEIESDLDEKTNQQIKDTIIGTRHIGHSRTAQYGLVKIEEDNNYSECPSSNTTFDLNGKTYATVYADGRLIFLDENGEPTFRPSAQDLGFGDDALIDWSKSQIRTFQYSPWNGKRHTYDTDRCGFEKGSVFVVECDLTPSESSYVGNYQNEGFGKVIYNPSFLSGNTEGKAEYRLEAPDLKPEPTKIVETLDTPLLKFLNKQKSKTENTQSLYQDVNDFVHDYGDKFKGEQFASQWGSIRNIAMIVPDESQIKEQIETFLTHGVAEAKWNEHGRREVFVKFMEDCTEKNIRDRVMNLASEMAKICRKEEKKS